MPSYKEYSSAPDGNNANPPPIGAPEFGFVGKYVNDIMRYMMAVVRTLGDATLKVDGVTMDGDDVAGSMALQNATAVSILGGTIDGKVGGAVPLKGIIDYAGTLTEAAALAPAWGICDGRTVNGVITPDLRGLFIQAWSATVNPGSTGGTLTGVTGSAGAIAGNTGGHTLTAAELPAGAFMTYADTNGGPGIHLDDAHTLSDVTNLVGAGTAHTHSISAPAHTHTVDPPPYYAAIKLMRCA